MNRLAGAILNAVLNTGWQAIAITGAVWVLLKVTRVNAATRHVIWWAVLAMLVVLPLAPVLLESRQSAFIPMSPSPAHSELAAKLAESAPMPPLPQSREGGPVDWRPGNLPVVLLGMCVAVFLIQCLRVAKSYLYVRRIRNGATPASGHYRSRLDGWMTACRVSRRVDLLISDKVVSPMAVGFRHPAIILPEGVLGEFQDAELDHVLLHELAHLVRRDDWNNLAARCAGGLLALHPVAIWVLRRIPREQEIACDDWVVAMTGAPRPYAACLARLFDLCFSRRRVLLASGMADRASHLGERIEGLLQRRREFAPSASLIRVAGMVALLAVLVAAAARAPRWIVLAQEAPQAPPTPSAVRTPQSAPPAPPARPRSASKAAEPAPAPPPAVPITPRPPAASRPQGFLAAVVAAGYDTLSIDEIVALKTSGVTGDYLIGVSQSGWGKLTARQIIDLKNQGVPPDYLHAARASGIAELAIGDLADLRNHGVRIEEVRQIHTLGFGPYNKRQIIDMWMQGVRLDLFQALKDGSFAKVDPGEVIEARQAGLRPRDFSEARQYGSNLTLKQILKLKRAGVLQ